MTRHLTITIHEDKKKIGWSLVFSEGIFQRTQYEHASTLSQIKDLINRKVAEWNRNHD